VLCVDDEPNILAVRSALLGMAGYKVHVAKDGQIGLEIFRNQPVDLVVLDYDMPGMMGDEVAREMRRLPTMFRCYWSPHSRICRLHAPLLSTRFC